MKKKKKVFVFIDRDGTLIYDDKYYLGRTNNWKKKIKILPEVIQGITRLRTIPEVQIHMVTNQTGVAIQNFPLLTVQRAHTVCKEVLRRLNKRKAKLDGYYLCEHVSPQYAQTHSEHKYNKKLVCNCSCIKPREGMIHNALLSQGLTHKDSEVYMIGDRASDVRSGIRAQGYGILVPFENEPGEDNKVKKMTSKKKYIAKDFLDATRFIVKKELR